MDFRSCPACQASVLEEDVEECPFCGASMSGKPQSGSKPSVAAKPKPAVPPSRPAGKPTASSSPAGTPPSPGKPSPGKPAPAKPAASEKDDPFEVDTSVLRRAIKLAPRPTKTRTLEVTCPMCETSGFMLPADAGKDVHCCNPECLVPIFKTQKPKVETAPVEEPRNRAWVIYTGGLLTLIVAGVAVWFFVLNPPKPEVVDTPEIPQPETPIQELNLTPENRVVQTTEAPPATLKEIRMQSLAAIVDRARQRDHNRSPEYGTQLAAESFANAGELAKAGEQIRRLQSTAAQAPYLQIQPLVDVGWQQLAAGQMKEAQASVATALSKSQNAPRSIRKTLDAITSLAALAIAVDQQADAEALINREQDFGLRGELSALWRAAVDAKTFQIDLEHRAPWHLAMPEPMRLSVIECLVTHQQADKAAALTSTATNAASRAMCQAAWAGRLTQQDPERALDRVTTGLKAMQATPATQAQIWASVAFSAIQAKRPDLAEAALKQALEAAASINAPKAIPVPTLRQIHNSDGKAYAGLPDPTPAQANAQAFAAIALAQLESGQTEAAWTSFQQAVQQTQGMAPSATLTQELLTACETREASLRAQLNDALNLGNNQQRIGTEFARYRRQCGKLHAVALQRLDLQTAFLQAAIEAGLTEQSWSLIQERLHSNNPQTQEPYLETPLPGLLISLAEAENKPELARKIQDEATEKRIEVDPLDQLYARASIALAAGNLPQSSDLIKHAYRAQVGKKQPDRIDEISLRLCARAQSASTPDAVVTYIKNLADVVMQEEALLQLAGYSMQHGTAPELWKQTTQLRDLEALDRVSLFRGFVAGYTPEPVAPLPVPEAPMKK